MGVESRLVSGVSSCAFGSWLVGVVVVGGVSFDAVLGWWCGILMDWFGYLLFCEV